jgi:PAS domain S-box-containing protein
MSNFCCLPGRAGGLPWWVTVFGSRKRKPILDRPEGIGPLSASRSCVSIVRGMVGMEITHKQRPRLHAVAAQFLLGIAGVALITFVCFEIGFGVGRTSLAYLIWIALVSLLGSFVVSVVLSIVAVACLNYFFVPPLFEFRVDDPDDIVRMAAFLTASLLVTALTTKLRASETRFRSFINHATDGFFLFDEHQALVDVNSQACESLGYSPEEMIGKHPRDFDAGLDEASIARIGEQVASGETVTFETRHRRKDGTIFPVEVRARQFQHGAHRFRLSLARDITEASARRKRYARVKPGCRRRSTSRTLAGGSGTSPQVACFFRTRFVESSGWRPSTCQNGTRAG